MIAAISLAQVFFTRLGRPAEKEAPTLPAASLLWAPVGGTMPIWNFNSRYSYDKSEQTLTVEGLPYRNESGHFSLSDLVFNLLFALRVPLLIAEKEQGDVIPDFRSWKEYRKAVVEGAQRYWEIDHPSPVGKVGYPSQKEQCFEAIDQGLHKDNPHLWPKSSLTLALQIDEDGPVMELPTQYRLKKYIDGYYKKENPNYSLAESIQRKYAKLWLCTTKVFNRMPLTEKEMEFVKKQDPSLLDTIALLKEGDSRTANK